MTTAILPIAVETGYGYHDPSIAGLKLVWDGTEGYVYATTDDEGHTPSTYAPLQLPGVLKLGSGPTTVSNAAGELLLAAIEQDGAASNEVLAWNGSEWAPATLSALGAGDVTGPGPTVTDTAVVLFDGTGGLTIKESGVLIDASDNVTGVASLTLDGTVDYVFGQTGNAPYIQGQTSSLGTVVQFFSKDGDGTDACYLNIYGKGTPGSVTNSEALYVGYNQTTPDFQITATKTGTGTQRALALSAGTSNQLLLNTDGTVQTASSFTSGANLSCGAKFSMVPSTSVKGIVSGAITATQSFHPLTCETGLTDDLDTINGGTYGMVLVITAFLFTVTAKDNTGNMKLAGDFAMNSVYDRLTLMYDGTYWIELCRSNNA